MKSIMIQGSELANVEVPAYLCGRLEERAAWITLFMLGVICYVAYKILSLLDPVLAGWQELGVLTGMVLSTLFAPGTALLNHRILDHLFHGAYKRFLSIGEWPSGRW